MMMNVVESFVSTLLAAGYTLAHVVLFGSYAKGHPNPTSDIDLAIWDERFVGCGTADIAPIAHLVSKYPHLEVHTFALDDTPANNPFVGEILRHGVTLASA